MDTDARGVFIFIVSLILGVGLLIVVEETIDRITTVDFLTTCMQQNQAVKDCADALNPKKQKGGLRDD